ncbi:MAG: TlpA family protein disulfide reductase [Bacteroidetes bacterium]|nr:TlpA family protein disulfide reductase [Bacteroidota bacterium]
MRKALLVYLWLYIFCSNAQTFKKGIWRGVLTLSETKNEIILPFNFNVKYINNAPVIEVLNADEKIVVDEVSVFGDSVNFYMPVFDTEFRTALRNDSLNGVWINHTKKTKNVLQFEAVYNNATRFVTTAKPKVDFTGRYEVTFNAGTSDAYKAVGIFKQSGSKVTGTFLTETGDYRYLEGAVQNSNMSLSCFDGSHAFLFFMTAANKTGKVNDLEGKVFYSNSGTENFVAKRNEQFKLKNPESITVLKTPGEKIYFTFPDTDGKKVSLSDEKYKNKVIIIQLMGSWCPNCMDETAYLSKVYHKYQNSGLEIIALAYERTDDFEKAKKNVLRLKKRFMVDYDVLITGLTGKAKAAESLPFFNNISAFPTTIILDRNHEVKSIYTGFSGPATGKAYVQYTEKTEHLVEQLLLKK